MQNAFINSREGIKKDDFCYKGLFLGPLRITPGSETCQNDLKTSEIDIPQYVSGPFF